MTSQLTIQQAVDQALQSFGCGKAQESHSLCQQILNVEPSNADALHLMGVLEMQAQHFASASQLIGRAIASNPSQPGYYCNLGQSLAAQGQNDQAIIAYRRALALNAEMFEARNNLANLLREKGEFAQAISNYMMVLRSHPNLPQVWNNMGLALQDAGRIEEALDAFAKAMSLAPTFSLAAENKAKLLHRVGRFEQAIAAYLQVLRINPDHVDSLNNMANALQDAGQMEMAVSTYDKALAIRPELPEVHKNRGNALLKLGQFERAGESFDQAIELRPDFAEAHRGRGNALRMLGRHADAITALRTTASLNPESASVYCDLGSALLANGDIDQAIGALNRAVGLKSDHPGANLNLGTTLLLRGDFERGLPLYEYRNQVNGIGQVAGDNAQPIWDGSDLNGKRILLHSERGLGDAIQYSRYIPMVATRGGRICLVCQPELHRLLQQVEGIGALLAPGDMVPETDVRCALPSLPLKFKTTLETIPSRDLYLQADVEGSARWRKRLGEPDGRKKIGLAWAGPPFPDPKRSMCLSQVAPLSACRNVRLISLQKGPAMTDLRKNSGGLNIENYFCDLLDVSETASLIDNLDLVITIDSMVAHLAAAMGKPTWLLLPAIPDWRWQLDRNDSPWYPSMRLFRQKTAGDWSAPISQVLDSLQHQTV
ncbi:MAG TPA: tetratricopeptide repeat protein [Tepidisphaeraceae bacterium]|nr:tetratricopeptide repeat protein [Tepidisphaeraceae bacterium]